jgi:hypothetical protein
MLRQINILFLGLTLLAITAVKAQSTDTVKTRGWFRHDIAGAAQIQVTYRQSNLSQLNQVLNRNNFPSLSSNNIWINASMSHLMHHWVLEDGLGFTPIETSRVNDLKARYNQYQAFFRLGYDVAGSSGFRLYPFAGINLSAAVLNIQDNTRTKSVTDFSQELLNSTSSKTFYQPNLGIELGGGFDYLIRLKPKKMDCFEIQRNIPIGIRAGYYINTYAGGWKIDGYNLQNSPTQKQSAVFVSANIGLGYMIKK